MAFRAIDVAIELLALAERDGKPLDPMKLQKLVYFAHGWHLAFTGEMLIDEQVQAWDYGPVIPSLYRAFREFGASPITRRVRQSVRTRQNLDDDNPDSQYAKEVIEETWRVYGDHTSVQLSAMTHRPGTPWYEITHSLRRSLGFVPKGSDIPVDAIREHFAERLALMQPTA